MKSFITTSVSILLMSSALIFNKGKPLTNDNVLVKSDFVEDPGTVVEIDPNLYKKDIYEDEIERTSQEYASVVEKFMSDL